MAASGVNTEGGVGGGKRGGQEMEEKVGEEGVRCTVRGVCAGGGGIHFSQVKSKHNT
jgi:hypothetical protein